MDGALHMRLSGCEQRGLAWVREWSRRQLTRWKRSRKYRPREMVIDAEEAATLEALIDLEKAVARLLSLQNVEISRSLIKGGR